jgi:3-oxoacyl-[acyl-carrier protein] reductase
MNKTALVTGASRGIGRAIAIKLANSGFNVMINYSGNLEKALEVKAECEKAGVRAEVFQANVGNSEEVANMVKETQAQFKTIDLLVNNAGITRDNLILRMSEADFDDVIDINLKGTFNCIKSVSKIMFKQRSGKIINISSVSGIAGNAGQANYAASKAGVIGLTKTVAREMAPRGICVNAIAPGYIETDMTDVLADEVKTKILSNIPLNRLGHTDDIANMTAFLASDQANFITGQCITVDGGMTL